MDDRSRHAAIFHKQGVERPLKDVENGVFGRGSIDRSNQLHLLVGVVETEMLAYKFGGKELHGEKGGLEDVRRLERILEDGRGGRGCRLGGLRRCFARELLAAKFGKVSADIVKVTMIDGWAVILSTQLVDRGDACF